MRTCILLSIALGSILSATVFAQGKTGPPDAFFDLPLSQVELVTGRLPDPSGTAGSDWRVWEHFQIRAELDGPGEAFVAGSFDYWNWAGQLAESGRLLVRAPAGRDVTGRIFLPADRPPHDGTGEILEFRIKASRASGQARQAFLEARMARYRELMNRQLPGTAWFRHQAEVSAAERDGRPLPPVQPVPTAARPAPDGSELGATFDLFTGNRAMGENLQLDRPLLPRGGSDEETVALSSLEGITVKEFQWDSVLKGKDPRKDPLAAYVPADQHALFFQTFSAMTRLMDEADRFGTPALSWLEPRSEDARTKERYQKQLCLPVSAIARLLGPRVIAGVAFTGSDPYLRAGSDVAVLFHAKNSALLAGHVRNNQREALAADSAVQERSGTVEGGLAYTGVCSADRSVCSYMAVREDLSPPLVVVTNSLAQLARISLALAGREPAMSGLPEYVFFRDRYPLGTSGETALLVLPDAAIRRWCGPRWRIGDSRRTRAAALLSELQARQAALMVREAAGAGAKPEAVAGLGEVSALPSGVLSSTYGTLEFLTPVAELPVERVTEAEAQAYRWFRDGYQHNWRQYFDPIAVRFHVEEESVAVDVSVMPLIGGSEYRELVDLTRGNAMTPGDGDPHEEMLFRFGMSLNPESEPVRKAGSFAVSMAPGLQGNIFSWLGRYLVVYGDRDRFWTQLASAEKPEAFMEKNFHRLPMAVRVDVSSPMKLTAFLTSVRAFIEQTAPGMTLWETKEHAGLPYVKVSPAQKWDDDVPDDLAFYYAVSGNALILTLSRQVLESALARQAARSGGAKTAGLPWLGEHVNFQADRALLDVLEAVARREVRQQMQRTSWANIPVLNEWRRMFPDRDPVEVHERIWKVRLECPGGGKYVWNEEWRTLESTVMGHPGRPKEGPGLDRPPLSWLESASFGLTFEHDGIRAKAELRRDEDRTSEAVRMVTHAVCEAHPNLLCTLVPLLAVAIRISAQYIPSP